MTLQEAWPGLAVAAGSGPQRQPAGIRSFTLAALAGAMAPAHGEPLLVAAGALSVLADAHAPVASTGALFAAGRLDDTTLVWCVLLAWSSNAASRTITAAVAGGPRYAGLIGASLLASTGLAWGLAALAGHLP
ncbi:hypothetical protein M8A51_11770 [Schlegelella sp. S2-27]|uniref:DUF4010 domain-containing protein n=1 Tax=Caldimonas mangrovi TaxID=2944811 RepID=A0ABT0YPF3_9BURK|nr:hypothetical protein [Caldimonas mangrovi]MCM5680209.1 hypothetical protein [Caldimonas mangrovi]